MGLKKEGYGKAKWNISVTPFWLHNFLILEIIDVLINKIGNTKENETIY